jgi:hypothetical protein
MKISQEELTRRLNSSKNILNKISTPNDKEIGSIAGNKGNDSTNRNNCGRESDIPNAPKSLRVVAGICSKIDNGVVAAKALDLSTGQTRYAEKKVEKLTEKQVQEVALTRLMDALGLINKLDLLDEKPKELSAIAMNLSRVHQNLRPKDERAGNEVNVTIYTPAQRTVEDFEVIDISA